MQLFFLNLSDQGTQLLLLLLAVGVVGWWKGRRLLADWQAFRQWQAAGKPTAAATVATAAPVIPAYTRAPEMPTPTQPVAERPRSYPLDGIYAPFPVHLPGLPATKLSRAGDAMAQPPTSLWYTLDHIREHAPINRYTFPIGWWINPNNEARLAVGHLVNDVYCGLVTAIQGGGKDNALLNMLLTLMLLNNHDDVQVVIIDGKGGLDYNGWDQKAHVWHVARHGHELIETMDLLTAERMRRVNLLYDAGVSKWENLKPSERPPLMVVVFSELKALQQTMKRSEIETYLDAELSVWRALGMRMFVCTQNSSNWSKEWRAAFEFFMAGTQPSRDEDKPNTGKDQSTLRTMGLVPPSELPDVGTAPGVLTVVHGNHGRNVRTSLIDDAQRAYWLDYLPAATDEQRQARIVQKQQLLRDLATFRASVDQQEQLRKAGVWKPATRPELTVVTPIERSVVSDDVAVLAHAPAPAEPYNRQALAQVLADIQADRTKKLDDLLEIPLFIQACTVEFQRIKSISGVVKALWGNYSGPKDRVVKAALERAASEASLQLNDDHLLQGLLAA